MGAPRIRRNILEEEAAEMRRKRPVRPRVKLNRDAVWALLDQLGISQTELAQMCGLEPEGDVKAQFLEWYQVREGQVSGDTHYGEANEVSCRNTSVVSVVPVNAL